MKSHSLPRLLPVLALAALLFDFCPVARGQAGLSIPIPSGNGRTFETRNTGSNSDVKNRIRPAPKPKVVKIEYTAVSQLRTWMNNKGQIMTARLLAFSAPKKGETGPVIIIREGKIRFLLANAKKPILYPLANLSEADREYVEGIAKAARKGKPTPGQTEEGAEKKAPAKP